MDIANKYSPLALAFIGDADYNLRAKRYIIDKEVKSDNMQKMAANFCSAKSQARYSKYLIDNSLLTEDELNIFKRGRNAKGHNAPKNTDIVTYKVSTGFEAVWGYWYLTNNTERMEQIWNIIETIEEQ